MLKQILLLGVAAFVMVTTVKDGILGGNFQRSLTIIKRIRPLMIVENTIVLTVVAVVATLLNTLPVVSWGWWQLLDEKTSPGGQNAIIASTNIPFIGSVFLIVLFFALPRLAELEEELFREGTANWSSGVKRSAIFGIMHCMMGVSLGVGLALGIAGLWFTHQYFKGGVKRSTAYHAAWNLSIISFLAVIVLTA